MNAIGRQMLGDFMTAIGEIKNPKNGARCVLLTGEGRGFCAGANLQDDSKDEGSSGAGSSLRHSYHPILFELRGLDMPIVTAVNGAAAGVGMSFAMMGDIVCVRDGQVTLNVEVHAPYVELLKHLKVALFHNENSVSVPALAHEGLSLLQLSNTKVIMQPSKRAASPV